jgi:hypothetical protein
MHAHFLRLVPGPPLRACILAIAHQFLILGVHRDHRLAASQVSLHLLVDVGKLRIAIRMRRSFFGLPVRLRAVVQFMQQFGDHRIAHLVPQFVEFRGELADTLAGPPQTGFRVAARRRLDEILQIRDARVAEGQFGQEWLNTNTLIHFSKGSGRVRERLLVSPGDVAIPSVVLYELQAGIEESRQPAKRRVALEGLLAVVSILLSTLPLPGSPPG